MVFNHSVEKMQTTELYEVFAQSNTEFRSSELVVPKHYVVAFGDECNVAKGDNIYPRNCKFRRAYRSPVKKLLENSVQLCEKNSA